VVILFALKTSGDFSFGFSVRSLTLPNFAVIENCAFRPHFGRYSFLKLGNLSFAYLHRFSHFMTLFSLSIEGKRKEKLPLFFT
jgi:hypothetical protein